MPPALQLLDRDHPVERFQRALDLGADGEIGAEVHVDLAGQRGMLQAQLDRTNAMDFTNFRREKKIANRKPNRQDKKVLKDHRSQQHNRKSNQRSRRSQ